MQKLTIEIREHTKVVLTLQGQTKDYSLEEMKLLWSMEKEFNFFVPSYRMHVGITEVEVDVAGENHE
jgi:hypothetical protein